MLFPIITFITAIAIAAIAAWFSVYGLMAIFTASAVAVAIMAVALEVGKLVVCPSLEKPSKMRASTAVLFKSIVTFIALSSFPFPISMLIKFAALKVAPGTTYFNT